MKVLKVAVNIVLVRGTLIIVKIGDKNKKRKWSLFEIVYE